MSRLFVPNFAFDPSPSPAGTTPLRLRRLEEELAIAWGGVADEGDFVLCRTVDKTAWRALERVTGRAVAPVTDDELRRLPITDIVPFGWTREVRLLAARLSLSDSAAPPQEVIQRVNSRRYAHAIARDEKVALAGAVCAATRVEVEAALRSGLCNPLWQDGWIVKGDHSQSGRDQLRGRGKELSGKQAAQLERLLRRQGAVVVEPLLRPVAEQGWQWDLPVCGQPVLLGVTDLLTDGRGGWRGTIAAAPGRINAANLPAAERPTFAVQSVALQRMQADGYHGAVGIDAMIYRTDGGTAVRPLQDINARWTMGRLAMCWTARLTGQVSGLSQSFALPRGVLQQRTTRPPGTGWRALSPDTLAGAAVQQRLWWRLELEAVR